MKITSHAMEDYIFAKIVLPLKDLRLQAFNLDSPIRGIELTVSDDHEYLNNALRRAQFNYQRDMIRRKAPLLVRLDVVGHADITIGRYDRQERKLVLMDSEAKQVGCGHIVSKIYTMFSNYPQYTVKMIGGHNE